MNDCSPEIEARTEVTVWNAVERRPTANLGKADALWEETRICTTGATGVRVQASGERSAEITSGRANSQQGLVATCKDPPTKDKSRGGGRVLVWRMRSYELRRRGNALRSGARRHSGKGNTSTRRRTSGHLVGLGRSRTQRRGSRAIKARPSPYMQTELERGVHGPAFKPHHSREGSRGQTRVRTGIGKSDLPGSQGGPGKRGPEGCARLGSIPTVSS